MNPAPQRKIVTLPELLERLAPLRPGRQVVQCHGCFDIVHPGHIRYLQFARRLGDLLIVSLTGDANIAKGPDRPYIPEELRAENLAALEFVDFVIIDPHPTACELLTALRPDIYVKGGEYASSADPRFLREREIIERGGGRVVFHSGDVVYSSTRLIPTLNQEPQLDRCRLQTLCLRHGVDEAAIARTLAAVENAPVVVVGDVLRDQYVFCDVQDIAEDAPIPLLRRLAERSYWAAAAGVALQARALGARCTLVTSAGIDSTTKSLEDDCRNNGIALEVVPRTLPLCRQQSFVADDARLFQVRSGEPAPLDSSAEHDALERILRLLDDARLLIWCDHGLGMVSLALAQRINEAARRRGVTVAAGVAGRGDARQMPHCDLLCVSERRLRASSEQAAASVPALVWNLLERTDGRRALVSLHKRGLLTFDGGGALDADRAPARLRSEFVPALAGHYADLSGVDDVRLAGAALALAGGATPPLAAYLAAALEAVAVEQAGRAIVRLDALHAWLRRRSELLTNSRFVPQPPGTPVSSENRILESAEFMESAS